MPGFIWLMSGLALAKLTTVAGAAQSMGDKSHWNPPPKFETSLEVLMIGFAILTSYTLAKAIHNFVAPLASDRIAWPVAIVLACPLTILTWIAFSQL